MYLWRLLHSYKDICLTLLIILTLLFVFSCGEDDKGPNPIVEPDVGTYYVNDDTGSDSNDGSESDPFMTITRALAETDAGDTVVVAPGFYDQDLGESFPIDIPDSVLLLGNPVTQGTGSDSTIISGWGTVNTTYNATVVGGDGAKISGFMILLQTTDAFHVAVFNDNNDLSVVSNTIYSYWGGIYLSGGGSTIIENNRFRAPSAILYCIQSSSTGTVSIKNNDFSLSSTYAVGISGGTPLVENNYFSGNYINGTFRISSDASPILRNNNFEIVSNPAVLVTGTAAPDLGTSVDPGFNVFAGSNTVAVRCESSGKIYAIGNTWHNEPPICESDIVVDGDGVVVWGTGDGDSCTVPISGEFVADANTIALWHFNTGSGTTVYDATGNGHNGTLGQGGANEPDWEAAGRFGYGLSFDGVNEEFVLAGSLAEDFPSNQLTIEMWLKAPSTPDFVHLFRSDNICALDMNNLKLSLSIGDGSGTWKNLSATILTLTDGNWHYLACTFNGTTLNVFVDGVNRGTEPDAAISMVSPDGYYIGGYPANEFFTGVIDELRLSKIARSSTEIANYYDLVSGLR